MHQVVPTIDTARFTLLAKRLLAMGRSVFLGGPSGCGKTVLMSQIAAMGKGTSLAANTTSSSGSGAASGVVEGGGDGEDSGARSASASSMSAPPPVGVSSLLPAVSGELGVFTVDINFSGRSTSAATQRTIESRLLKRHGTALGPPPGSKVGRGNCCCCCCCRLHQLSVVPGCML